MNCSGSQCGHFWRHEVTTKMCLTISSFILIQVVSWVCKKNKWRNYLQFLTCFHGLVDKRLDCKTKGPRFKTYLGTMLQRVSKCEVKTWLCWNLILLLPLRFYMKSNFGAFKRSKNVIFGNFRDSELWSFGKFGT